MRESFRTLRGVLRSLRIYYGDRSRRAAMDALYARFVTPDDLVFDIGAHVGDRVAAFRRLGARVVAVEPQPALVRTLRLLYGRDADVTITATALGRSEGTVELRLNVDNPTVSTASTAFVQAADGAPGWEGQAWTRAIAVPVTTLDALIARHGTPAFVKIDVEGFEEDVVAGMRGVLASPTCRALFIEVHFALLEARKTPDAPARIVAELRRQGFRTRWLDPSHLMAWR